MVNYNHFIHLVLLIYFKVLIKPVIVFFLSFAFNLTYKKEYGLDTAVLYKSINSSLDATAEFSFKNTSRSNADLTRNINKSAALTRIKADIALYFWVLTIVLI